MTICCNCEDLARRLKSKEGRIESLSKAFDVLRNDVIRKLDLLIGKDVDRLEKTNVNKTEHLMKRSMKLGFLVGDLVRIHELNKNGVVTSILITNGKICYDVRYFDNAEARNVYFYEDEISLRKDI